MSPKTKLLMIGADGVNFKPAASGVSKRISSSLTFLSTAILLIVTAAQTTTAQTYVISPEVHPDRTVTFRYFAPGAQKVALAGNVPEIKGALTKDANGVWSKTVGPLSPETYPYRFNVDGAAVTDPVNQSTKAWMWMNSLVDVPGEPAAIHQPQNVAHGQIHTLFYRSQQLKQNRRLFVYTPPGYSKSTDRFPVLYLLHGFGDDESAWTRVGMANHIADNVLHLKKTQPFIIVMLFGHENLPTTPKYGTEEYDLESNFEKVQTELIDNVIPLIEDEYRCKTDPQSRAVVGLSMGGGQAVRIGLGNSDRFGYVAGYSASVEGLNLIDSLTNKVDAIKTNQPTLRLACGDKDFLFEENKTFQQWLTDQGISHRHHWNSGDHNWRTWRKYFATTCEEIFLPVDPASATSK